MERLIKDAMESKKFRSARMKTHVRELKGTEQGERQPTFAFMFRDVKGMGKYLVVQFYSVNGKLGDFATAFRPNPRQEDAMFRAESVVR